MSNLIDPLKTLLVVDDEADIREMILDDFRKYELNLLFAENGEAAYEILQSVPVDAVLSDIKMPRMNGIELLQKVRESGAMTPFVFVTAFSEKEYFLSALRFSVIDYIEKPYRVDQLVRSVTYALNLGAQLRTLEVEISNILKANHVASEQIDRFRIQLREVLLLRKVNIMGSTEIPPLRIKAA